MRVELQITNKVQALTFAPAAAAMNKVNIRGRGDSRLIAPRCGTAPLITHSYAYLIPPVIVTLRNQFTPQFLII